MSVPSPMEGFARGTVPWVVRALVDWAATAGQGMALVVWKSARERDLAVASLQERFREKALKTDEVRALSLTLQEFVRAIEHNDSDVVLVLDADAVISGGEDRGSWRLNFFRESLIAFRGAQIWFLPEQAAIRFGRDLPDLARFFLFRETLAGEEAPERGRETAPLANWEPAAQDSTRGQILLDRALKAAAKGGRPSMVWLELGLPAIDSFLGSRNFAAAESAMAAISEAAGRPEVALEHAKSEGVAQELLAYGYDALGRWYQEQSMLEEALATQEKAVRIHRESVSADPSAFLPGLARSLNNLSNTQSGLGRREDALASIEEAVRIRRQLASTRPDAFLPGLAISLNNFSNAQRRLGQREDALASIEEAIRIYRQLASASPDAFLPDLAQSLNNLSNCQSDLGRREDALASIEEAVRIRRQLASARPDAFLPDLAMSLNSLSNRQSGLGRHEDALASIEEAVRIRHQLASARPDAFLPNLAGSLNNLSNTQSDLGRLEDALANIEEAVRTYRQLARTRPDAFLPDLAMSLNNLSNRQSDLGRREDALASIEEAVRIRRQLASTRPDAFLPNLAMSLSNLSKRQSDIGQPEQALANIEEAVRIYRQLAGARPDALLPHLAGSLCLLGDCLAASGQLSEALGAATESLRCLSPFAQRYPEAYRSLATTTLRDYTSRSEALGVEPDPELLSAYAHLLTKEANE